MKCRLFGDFILMFCSVLFIWLFCGLWVNICNWLLFWLVMRMKCLLGEKVNLCGLVFFIECCLMKCNWLLVGLMVKVISWLLLL